MDQLVGQAGAASQQLECGGLRRLGAQEAGEVGQVLGVGLSGGRLLTAQWPRMVVDSLCVAPQPAERSSTGAGVRSSTDPSR